MKAKFDNGPYDKVVLHVKDGIDVVRLPVQLTTTLLPEVHTFYGHARYNLRMKNDYEASFQFMGIEMS
jgi:hypothetical protein